MKIIDNSQKETFNLIKNICYATQVACFLYAFASMFYWFCSVAKFKFVGSIAFLFEPIYALVRLFYKQQTISVEEADLTGVIASIIFIMIAGVAKIVKDETAKQELAFLRRLDKKRKEADKLAQLQIQNDYCAEMKKYNKFIVLVNVSVGQVKSYLFDENTNQDGLETTKQAIQTELFASIVDKKVLSKAKYEDNSFYIIGAIEDTPYCIHKIMQTIQTLSRKHSEKNITISYDLSFDALAYNTDLNEKLKFLQKVLQLNFNNSILTTSLFKTCYDITGKKQMDFTVLGKFQFNIDETQNNYELYSTRVRNIN